MKNIIGVMSSTYVHYGLSDALRGIANSGFKYIELCSIPGMMDHVFFDADDIKKCGKLCKEYGIKILGIGAHERLMKEDAVKNFKKCIDLAGDLEVGYITTGTGNVESEEDRIKFYREISLLGEYAAKRNISICLEIHGDWLNNGKVATDVVKDINMGNIKINYDTANVIFYGNTRPEKDIKNALGNLGYVHLKDKRGGYKVWDFPALGEGEIDFKVIFEALQEYKGPMCVEIELDGKEHSLEEVDEAVKTSYLFLKDFGLVS